MCSAREAGAGSSEPMHGRCPGVRGVKAAAALWHHFPPFLPPSLSLPLLVSFSSLSPAWLIAVVQPFACTVAERGIRVRCGAPAAIPALRCGQVRATAAAAACNILLLPCATPDHSPSSALSAAPEAHFWQNAHPRVHPTCSLDDNQSEAGSVISVTSNVSALQRARSAAAIRVRDTPLRQVSY